MTHSTQTRTTSAAVNRAAQSHACVSPRPIPRRAGASLDTAASSAGRIIDVIEATQVLSRPGSASTIGVQQVRLPPNSYRILHSASVSRIRQPTVLLMAAPQALSPATPLAVRPTGHLPSCRRDSVVSTKSFPVCWQILVTSHCDGESRAEIRKNLRYNRL